METYIVNPAYKMRMDGNRVLITARGMLDEEKYDYESFISFAHPLNAQMLSFFNGKDDLQTVIRNIAKRFELTENETREIIMQYVENKKAQSIKTRYGLQNFPKKMIVKRGIFNQFEVYSPEDFPFQASPNLRTLRCVIPSACILELTMKCYTDCVYCYANRKMHTEKLLPTEKIISIIQEAKEYGIVDFNINGGEVLLHPDYKVILSTLLKEGYFPYVSTKVPLSQKIIDDLVEIGLNRIQVSLDSVNPTILSQMVHVKGNYIDLMTETFERLDKAGLKTIVHTIVTSYNSNLEEMRKLVDFVTKYSVVGTIRFTGVGASLYKSPENFDKIKPSNEFMRTLEREIVSFRKTHPGVVMTCSGEMGKDYFQSAKSFGMRSLCSANFSGIVILPDGRVTVCEELYDDPRFIIGDLNKQTIEEVWNSEAAMKLYKLHRDDFPDDSSCKNCESFDDCRHQFGTCWKYVFEAYGKDKFYHPDPRCPKAPELKNKMYFE